LENGGWGGDTGNSDGVSGLKNNLMKDYMDSQNHMMKCIDSMLPRFENIKKFVEFFTISFQKVYDRIKKNKELE